MRFTIPAGRLAAAVTPAAALAGHGPYAVLRLAAGDQQVTLTASDNATTLTTVLTAFVDTPGEVAILPRLFSEAVGSFKPADDLDLGDETTEAGSLFAIRCKKSRMNLQLGDLAAAPTAISLGDHPLTLDAADFAATLRAGGYAIDDDQQRVCLTGVHLFSSEGHLRAESTDTHRCAVALANRADAETFVGIVPGGFVKILLRRLDTGSVLVSLQDSTLSVQLGDTCLRTRLIDAEFPGVDRIFAKVNQNGRPEVTATLPRADLLAGIRLAATVAREDNRRLTVEFAPDELVLSSVSAKLGKARVPVPAEVAGELTVGLNCDYLRDAATNLPDGDLVLTCYAPNQPVLLRHATDATARSVIMPMQLV